MSNKISSPIRVIGGGLAGCEAAWQIAQRGVPVILFEMRPERGTDAHVSDRLAELVCSNSFRSDNVESNAVGLLHEEMRRAGALILQTADAHQVPAGGALAVDREGFAEAVQAALVKEPLVDIRREEVKGLPDAHAGPVLVATGPLTSPTLSSSILALTSEKALAFFDAIAPVIYKESIDFSIAWTSAHTSDSTINPSNTIIICCNAIYK